MPHLLPSTGRDERRAKRPWQEKKGALHQNTFCLGSFFVRLNPSPPHHCQHFFLEFAPSTSLISGNPTCLHIHFIKPWLSSAPCSTEQAVRSCLIGPQTPSCFSTSGKVNGCLWPGKMMSVSFRQKTGLPLRLYRHHRPFRNTLYHLLQLSMGWTGNVTLSEQGLPFWMT